MEGGGGARLFATGVAGAASVAGAAGAAGACAFVAVAGGGFAEPAAAGSADVRRLEGWAAGDSERGYARVFADGSGSAGLINGFYNHLY